MRVLSMTASFGCLTRKTLTLSPGLNVLYAPNGGGKSTWCAFLRAMLYGLDSRRRDKKGDPAEKNRWRPWSGAPLEGVLRLEHEGRILTLRRTSRSGVPLGDFSAVYEDTGDPVPGLAGETAGEALTGVSREVFDRSVFLRQNGLAVSRSGELERRITALVTTGEETVSYSQADELLRKWQRERRFHKTGRIPELEAEQAAKEQTLSQLSGLRDAVTEARLATAQWETELNKPEPAPADAPRPPAEPGTAGLVLLAAGVVLALLPLWLSDSFLLAVPGLALAVFGVFRALSARAPARKAPEPDGTRRDYVRLQLEQDRRRLQALEETLSGLGDPAALEARLEELTSELSRLRADEQALLLAQQVLEAANRTLREKLAPPLNARAGEYLSILTGGRYDRLTLSQDLEPAAEPTGDPMPRPVYALSKGTADQVYLAVRLALGDLLLPAPDRCPLILDDALAFFDDERLACALDCLRDIAETRQVLLFTCHRRESAYLDGCPGVHTQSL